MGRYLSILYALGMTIWLTEDNEEFEDALGSYCLLNGMGDELRVWICTFSQYQPKKDASVNDVGPTVQEQIAVDPFSQVLGSEGVAKGRGLVAIHTTTADLYSRLWCPYEMNQASVGQITVTVRYSRCVS